MYSVSQYQGKTIASAFDNLRLSISLGVIKSVLICFDINPETQTTTV